MSVRIIFKRQEDGVFVLEMNANDNRFNPSFLKELNDALDVVEKSEGPAALVVTSTSPKFFSNGLDTDYMASNPKEMAAVIRGFMKFAARLLVLPMPTVAAINGHAFAAGFMTALACDYRVMRADRGFLCLPEVDIHMGLAPGMNALVAAKISDAWTYRDAVLTGKRFAAKEALALNLVDYVTPQDQLLSKALLIANSLVSKGEDRATYGALKGEMYADAHKLLNSNDLGLAGKIAKL